MPLYVNVYIPHETVLVIQCPGALLKGMHWNP